MREAPEEPVLGPCNDYQQYLEKAMNVNAQREETDGHGTWSTFKKLSTHFSLLDLLAGWIRFKLLLKLSAQSILFLLCLVLCAHELNCGGLIYEAAADVCTEAFACLACHFSISFENDYFHLGLSIVELAFTLGLQRHEARKSKGFRRTNLRHLLPVKSSSRVHELRKYPPCKVRSKI